MQRIKKDDTVKVIAGKDRGKEGRVIRYVPREDRVLVEGINVATKHRRMQTTRAGAQEGGIVHEEVAVHASNVMPICPSCGVPTRVGATDVDGVKTRSCRKCAAEF
jgi:large subunit ribosomal protein L24